MGTDADLIVVGAGLSGCALVGRLRQVGWSGRIALVEAGRGPGGRTATRRRRDQADWRLDHGAPGFQVQYPIPEGLDALLDPLRHDGVLVPERGGINSLDEQGHPAIGAPDGIAEGDWWRGAPCMSSLCEGLLKQAGPDGLTLHWQHRVRWITRSEGTWCLADQDRTWQLRGQRLVLSGNLLAHPRSLAMLNWPDVPLREAVAAGTDHALDEALRHLARCQAEVRWNLMLDLPGVDPAWPRQIWLTEGARERWSVERLVLQPQTTGRTGLVVHGLHDGSSITPESQPSLLEMQEQRLRTALQDMLVKMPTLQSACSQATSLGVMRWGASQPVSHPLPSKLQWCPGSAVGFCGDYVEGKGFGRAQGALESGVRLAEHLASR